jgi:hypothetical protein
MNFKTIAIALTATTTIASSVIALAALKKSKQTSVKDYTDEEVEEMSIEETLDIVEAAEAEQKLIDEAPRVFKTYGIIALASAAVLAGLLISNSKHEEEVIEDITDDIDERMERIRESHEDFLEHAEIIARALGTSIKKADTDPETMDTYFELEDDSKADMFLEMITEKVNE